MSDTAPTTDETEDDEPPEWATTWEAVGRELLRCELAELRLEIADAFRDIEESLYGPCDGDGKYSGEVTPEHVRALRRALNQARRRVENELAPVAGVEPWTEPYPPIPNGVLWEWTDHPRADGIDPNEYVEAEASSDE